MNYLFTSALLVTISLCSGSVVKSPETPDNKTFELLILHNNDMHARFEQTSQLSGVCTTADRDAGKCYGGFPRVATVVKQARAEAASGQGPPVLYLNAGDTYTGTAWFTIYKWKIAAEFINALNPDAVALGNNELEKESKNTSPFLNNIKTTILASNVGLNSADTHVILEKSVIVDVKGVQVGLIGFLTPEADVLENLDVEYINEVIAVQEEATKLKVIGVNIIIAVGHSNNEKVKEIAKEVSEIDLIINGNKNVYYWNGTTIAENMSNSGVFTVTQASGKKVPIVKSTSYDKYLGEINVKFNSDGDVTKFNAQPILLDASIPQDSEATEILTTVANEVLERNGEEVGSTAVVLDGDSCKREECNLGNLIADAIMYRYATLFEGNNWTDAPIAIIQGGAIAASISPPNRPASVTKNDIRASLPTESHLAVVKMNASVLLQVLERSVYEYRQNNDEFLQLSGIRVVYDLDNEPGNRVVSVVARCHSCFVPDYFPLEDNREYTVIMPASIANGDNGYSMLVGLPRNDLTYDEVTCTEEYIAINSPVYPEVAHRITLLNSSAMLFASLVSVLSISVITILLN